MVRKSVYFVFSLIFAFSAVFLPVSGVLAASSSKVTISSFTKTPSKATLDEKIYFRVRVDGNAKSVYMTVDGSGKYLFTRQRNSSVWELEKKLSIVGIRRIEVYAVDDNGNSDKVSDTVEIVETSKEDRTTETTTETTTERQYTGNIVRDEDETEITTEKYKDGEAELFNGSEYSGEAAVGDEFFELSVSEDLSALDEIAVNSVFIAINKSDFYVKGQKKAIDENNKNVVPYIKSGYTLVPLRAIGEALSADVSWNEETRTAEVSISGSKIMITAGSSYMNVNGNQIELDVSADISDGRIFLPLRAVSEAFNKNVFYADKFIGITEKRYNISENALLLIKNAVERNF